MEMALRGRQTLSAVSSAAAESRYVLDLDEFEPFPLQHRLAAEGAAEFPASLQQWAQA